MSDLKEESATYDIANITIREVTECGRAVRTMGMGASSMEEVADRIVRCLHNALIDGKTGEPACSLIRFFMAQVYEGLNDELKGFVLNMLGGSTPLPEMKCLTLLATASSDFNINNDGYSWALLYYLCHKSWHRCEILKCVA